VHQIGMAEAQDNSRKAAPSGFAFGIAIDKDGAGWAGTVNNH